MAWIGGLVVAGGFPFTHKNQGLKPKSKPPTKSYLGLGDDHGSESDPLPSFQSKRLLSMEDHPNFGPKCPLPLLESPYIKNSSGWLLSGFPKDHPPLPAPQNSGTWDVASCLGVALILLGLLVHLQVSHNQHPVSKW